MTNTTRAACDALARAAHRCESVSNFRDLADALAGLSVEALAFAKAVGGSAEACGALAALAADVGGLSVEALAFAEAVDGLSDKARDALASRATDVLAATRALAKSNARNAVTLAGKAINGR